MLVLLKILCKNISAVAASAAADILIMNVMTVLATDVKDYEKLICDDKELLKSCDATRLLYKQRKLDKEIKSTMSSQLVCQLENCFIINFFAHFNCLLFFEAIFSLLGSVLLLRKILMGHDVKIL